MTGREYPDGRFYWTDSADLDGDLNALPLVRVCDEDNGGILAWAVTENARWLAAVLESARSVIEAKEEGGDLYGLVDSLEVAMRPPHPPDCYPCQGTGTVQGFGAAPGAPCPADHLTEG
jgi:hypothetical protein